MTAEQLLQELETLTHTARIRRMVELGRTAAHDPQSAATLTTLEQGNFYERFLALHSCFGSYDGAQVLRALADPSRIIRGVAINLAALAFSEKQLRQALEIVPRDGRRPLLWKLHHHGYDTLIADFLERLAAVNDLQLRKLLPYGSHTLVRQHIARIQPSMGLVDWRRLTRHHPTIAFELLRAKAESATRLDLQLVAFVNGILPILANKQPDQALRLVETLARSVPLSRLDLQALILQRPEEMVDLAQRGEDLGEMDFSYVAHRLDNERLFALRETHPTTLEYYSADTWLSRMKPARRSTLYAVFAQSWRDEKGRISAGLVALLPRSQREREGHRHLALSALATRPEERLPYAAFLPWDEARDVLGPFLHDPSEKIRSLALRTLVQVVRYERDHLPEVLAIVQTHLHEPDPVCGTMVNSLAELPRGIWRVEHLDDIEQIIQGVVNAFGTSSFTIGASLLLLTRLLACAPEWSAAQLASVAQARGLTFHYGCIENRLSNADIRQIGPALRPVLISWAEKEDEETLLYLLTLFGKRVRVFDELLDALELAFNRKASFQFCNTVLSTIVTYRPTRAAQLIPELIQGHRDWITYPAVLTYLHRYRQDLLTPFLSQKKYSSLFSDTSNKGVIYRRRRREAQPLTSGFTRWTSQQQASFARTLLRVVNDTASDQQTIMRAIKQLAALPAVPARHLIALANDKRPFVRDTALILLRRLDAGQGVPILQEALHDQRAVRALYALRPFLLAAPPHEALTILRAVPFTKVTVAKEVVRLLGDLPGEEAFQELLALDGQELHRDVRVALVRAFWRHIGRDEAWHILERETISADKMIALSTVRLGLGHALAKAYHARKRFQRRQRNQYAMFHFFRFAEWNTVTMTHISGEHLSLHAQQRLMRLFALLLARPEPDVRAAALKGCTRLPEADEGQVLLSRLLEAMDSDNEDICTAAASAIFGNCVADDAPVIDQAIGHLLPNRRALQEIVQVLLKVLPINRRQLVPVVRAVIYALAVDPLTIELRIELAIVSLPWDEMATVLAEAAAMETLHADALHQACNMLGLVIGRHGTVGRPDSKNMVHLEEKLAASHDERLRRIALAALVAQAEESNGWNEEQRARLENYRADSSVLVAAAAQFTMLPNTEA
jgi:hypothetical protein